MLRKKPKKNQVLRSKAKNKKLAITNYCQTKFDTFK